ncbi:MAG: hypothetical protein R3C52_12070 [Hyphomonadaceae bacterium]
MSVLACAAWSAAGSQAFADAPAEAEEADAIPQRVFDPGYFDSYAPRSALDMVAQTPGFSIHEERGQRGLGQAKTNVLINSRRVSSKATSVREALSRISADQVVRIEIVDGSRLNIPGLSGQVANVITRSSGFAGRWDWFPEVREGRKAHLARGKVVATGHIADWDFATTLSSVEYGDGSNGPEYAYAPDGTLVETRLEDDASDGQSEEFSIDFNHASLSGAITNVSVSGSRFDDERRELSDRSGTALPDHLRIYRAANEGDNLEIGADHEFGLGPGRLKLIALNQTRNSHPSSRTTTTYVSALADEGSWLTTDESSGESIVRSEYSWLDGSDNDWQLSLEGAFNYLDKASELQELSGGVYLPEELDGAMARVEEKRAEAAVVHGRKLSNTLTIQGLAGAEYSQLVQTGPEGKSREFIRPKGFLALSWQPVGGWDYGLRFERAIGQLNFGSFISSVDLRNEGGQNQSGNPEIVPSQSWNLELAANGDIESVGPVQLKLFGRHIEDVNDSVLFSRTVETDGAISISEGPGNLDSAKSYGVDLSGTLQMEKAGVPGAKLDWGVMVAESSIEDPVTGEDRRLSNSQTYRMHINFRQDIPSTDWAWGLNYSEDNRGPSYRITQLNDGDVSPAHVGVYLQNKDVMGMSARLRVDNVLDREDKYTRIVYSGTRLDPVDSYEQRYRQSGLEVGFSLSGSF